MCGVDICPVHTRTTLVEAVQANVPARAITYEGDYAVATLDNPDFDGVSGMIAMLTGGELPQMFMHLVVKVGPDKALGDVLEKGDGELEKATVFRETFLSTDDSRLLDFQGGDPLGDTTEFNAKLTEIMHEAHALVLQSVKDGIIS